MSLLSKAFSPTIFVIFGATGDLMARKILPALFYLYKEGGLPKNFRVIGVSRRELSREDFREHLKTALEKFDEIRRDQKLKSFLKLFSFVRGFFDELYTYEDLRRMIPRRATVFFYLSVTPEFFKPILKNLVRSRSITSIIHIFVEKPIGLDLKGARSIEKMLGACFSERQIYRVDHYLAKDGLEDLFNFRFRERSIWSVLSRDHISKIELKLWEKKDIAGRGEFYDGVGALRDVGQNHMLEMLAVLTMEKPDKLSGFPVEKARARALLSLKIPTTRSAKIFSRRAQYRGYRNAKGVKHESKTETFFRVTAFLRSKKFRGVPIIMEAGKAMPENRKVMTVYFKDGRRVDFPVETYPVHYQYVEEYKKIFKSAFQGDAARFVSRDEIFASWKFIDPIIKAFKKSSVPLKFYEPHTYPKI